MMVERSHISVCLIVIGIILLVAVPSLAPSVAFKMNSYHSTVGLWDLRYESGQGTSHETTPPKNYFLPPNSYREDTFLKCGVAVGAESVYVEPANLGEVNLRVQPGTIDIYIFDDNNSVRWKAARPYAAVSEAKEIGTANLTFPIPIDAQTLSLNMIIVNNSPTPKNVTVGGKLQLVAEWTVNIRNPFAVTASLFLGFGTIICGIILLITSILKKHSFRRIDMSNRSKYMILLAIILSVTSISFYFYNVRVSKTYLFNQELNSIRNQYATIHVPASLQDLLGIHISLLPDNPATLPVKQVHSLDDFGAILEQRPVSTIYYNSIDRAMWFITLQPGEVHTYELDGETYTYQSMDIAVIYYVQSILGSLV